MRKKMTMMMTTDRQLQLPKNLERARRRMLLQLKRMVLLEAQHSMLLDKVRMLKLEEPAKKLFLKNVRLLHSARRNKRNCAAQLSVSWVT